METPACPPGTARTPSAWVGMTPHPDELSTDRPLIIEQLLLEADDLSAAGAPHDQVDDLIHAALELLTDQTQAVR